MNSENKLEICKQTRKYAADSLYRVLKKLLASDQPISEVLLRDSWLAELRKNPGIFPDGWYTPPPHGMIILFADDQNINRVNYKSARPEKQWPRDDIFLDRKKGIIFIYASPVDKKSGIIGDFGLTLYFGKNKKIQNHLSSTYKINKEIFNFTKPGLELHEINTYTHKTLQTHNLFSNLSSPSDQTGTNTGHTIPVSHENWDNNQLKILHNGNKNWTDVCSMISKKRKFVNAQENLNIQPGMAFTIEPRPENPQDPEIPMVLFHTIALFNENGSKELLTNFDDFFKLARMSYMLK